MNGRQALSTRCHTCSTRAVRDIQIEKRLSVGRDISGTSHCALKGIQFEVVAQSDMTVRLVTV